MLRLSAKQKRLAERHAVFAVKLARRYCRQRRIRSGVDDVLASAYLGLVDAASRWDELRGVKFETFATRRILGQIAEDHRRFNQKRKAGRADVRIDSLNELNAALDGEHELGEAVGKPDAAFAEIDHADESAWLMRDLSEYEKRMYRQYHRDGLTMKAIGKREGYCESRISQMLKSIAEKLEATCSLK